MKKALPFVILALIAAFFGGGYFLYKRTEDKQRAAREQAFADLSQCLLGEPIASGDDTINGISQTQARVAHLPDLARGGVDGKPWPQRCTMQTSLMMDAVRESSMMDDGPKREILKTLDELKKDLEASDAQKKYLPSTVLPVWRAAEKAKLLVAPSSSVQGPPRPAVMDGSAELPFTSLFPVRGGKRWAFLVERKGKAGSYAVCAQGDAGMKCKEFSADGGVQAEGYWESEDFLPVLVDGKSGILHDGKITEIPGDLVRGDSYVDDKGTFYGLAFGTGDEDMNKVYLSVRAFGKSAKRIELDEILKDQLPESVMLSAGTYLLGRSLLITSGPDVLQVPFDEKGKLGKPSKIAPVSRGGFWACRTGKGFVIASGSSLYFEEGGKWSPAVSSQSGALQCAPNGVVRGFEICTTGGCSEPLSKQEQEAFLLAGQLPEWAPMGDKLVMAWAAKEGAGLFASTRALKGGLPEDTVFAEHIVEKSPAMGLFADDAGAIVVSEVEGRVLGAKIGTDGKVKPLAVSF